LRSADQAAVAGLLCLAMAAIAGSWIYRGGLQGRLIDVQQAEPRAIDFQLDINTAPWPEWTLLPGIGETLARRIVASRETEGPFRNHADVIRVPGIGPRTLERIRPYFAPLQEAEVMANSNRDKTPPPQ
jgi:competence protein ComEA